MSTFYDELEVTAAASPQEIKAAWKRLAKATHPDVNSQPGVEARFKRIASAYEVLSDPSRRSSYDASLRVPAPEPAPIRPKKRDHKTQERRTREQLSQYWTEQAYFEARIGHLGYWNRYGRFRR